VTRLEKDKSLDESIIIAKENIHIRNELIEKYKPFVASTIQKKIGRYVEYGIDEELSIGLIAFNEAIDNYDKNKGGFLSFAKIVVHRRLIDYLRKKQSNKDKIINEKEDKDKVIELYDKKSIDLYRIENENKLRQLEIKDFKRELLEWGLDFDKLVNSSPKHKKTRKLYKEIANNIFLNIDLLTYIKKNKRLPVQEIVNKMKVHRKKVERGRIYIIALLIIKMGDYPFLEEYISVR
jgi:RNA polymerase sigma factor